MGVQLTWDNPPADSSWENTEIHRSTSESGTYTLVDTQTITDTSYYDCSGDSSSWYKIRFITSTGSCTESDFSDPIQGDIRFLYADPTAVARVGGLNISDLPKDITVSDLYRWIGDVSRNIDNLTENLFGRTETFETFHSSKYLNVSKTFDIGKKNITNEEISFRNSISAATFTAINFGFDYDIVPESGRVYLYRFPVITPRRIRDIKVTGTYGQLTIPDNVRQLTEVLSAIRIFVHLTGGSFDDVTSYTLGEYSESLGEPFTNLRETIKMLEVEKKRLMQLTGISTVKTQMRLA